MTDNTDPSLSPDIKFQLVKKMERHKVIGLAGTELREHEAKYLEFHRLSGIILFERNIESLGQLADLLGNVEEKLSADGTPPLVMADHEGDFVSELRRLIGVPPSAMAIAASGDPSLARDVARATGEAMKKLGVNVVLAPVADCYFDPSSAVTGLRTFGRRPERVAEFVRESVAGSGEAGILTCAKHFPGHGASAEDSHERLAEIRKTLDELREAELLPFAAAIEAGTDMIMMAHIAFSLGQESADVVPASFDSRLIKTLLREELGFDGVVITDALEMEGARAHVRATYGGLGGGFERSLLAGADLLLYGSPVPERMRLEGDAEPMIAIEVMQTVIETLNRVVDRERIERKLEDAAKLHEGVRNLLTILDESEGRVRRLRERAAELAPAPTPKRHGNVISLQDYPSTPAIYGRAAEQGIVLARDPDSFVPVGRETDWVLLPIEFKPGKSLKRQDVTGFVDGIIRHFPCWRVGPQVRGFETDATGVVHPLFASSDRKIIMDAQRATGAGKPRAIPEDAAVLPVFSSRGRPPEAFLAQLADFVEQRQIPLVVVTGSPLMDWIPETVGCLLTFGASPQAAAAAAAVLAGDIEAQGTLDGLV